MDSPYLKIFNYYINQLRETGALERIHKAYEPAPQVCPNLTGKALGFKNCFGAFLVMIVGVGSAILLLVLESFMKKKTRMVTVMSANQSNSIEEQSGEMPKPE